MSQDVTNFVEPLYDKAMLVVAPLHPPPLAGVHGVPASSIVAVPLTVMQPVMVQLGPLPVSSTLPLAAVSEFAVESLIVAYLMFAVVTRIWNGNPLASECSPTLLPVHDAPVTFKAAT